MTSSTLPRGDVPRLPLRGQLDLTYRCNNRCLHCWVRLPADDVAASARELSFDEIIDLAGQARAMGCQRWAISGGEPMLRPDFAEVFDHLTGSGLGYSLNTNGTLITPRIARLLARRGNKMVAVYGATAEVYDDVTGTPGGFESLLQGLAYLREARADFTVQLVPMRANHHQWDDMVAFARSLSSSWRCGAAWLNLSADGCPDRNAAIAAQRLDARDVAAIDPPGSSRAELAGGLEDGSLPGSADGDDRLFARCIAARREFHVDPYGGLSWCPYIKDSALRYDLRAGTFREAWDDFIPSCAGKVRADEEWRAGCGSCERRDDCRWCAVYARLETGSYSRPVPYLCSLTESATQYRQERQRSHRRYFRVAGITVCVDSDVGFGGVGFSPEHEVFGVEGPGDDNVTLRHHFELPDLEGRDLGTEVYRRPPWAISRKDGAWIYKGILPDPEDKALHCLAVFNADHTRGTIYNPPKDVQRVRDGGWYSLSLFPTDQIWLGPLLAGRDAVLVHSAAAVINGHGLLFVGHSGAGKSTTMELLKAERERRGLAAEILCDDRNVVRAWPDGWRVHGTWSHGTTADVSAASAPLRGVVFLRQDTVNSVQPLTDRKAVWRLLLGTLVRPLVTASWWEQELDVLERLVHDVPFYTMRFDRSGAIVAEIESLVGGVKSPPVAP